MSVSPRGRAAIQVLFSLQFVIADMAMRGARAWMQGLSIATVLGALASAVLWAILARVATTKARRACVAGLAGSLLVVQALVFRHYGAPLDLQVAESAMHAWRDVRSVVLRALPTAALWGSGAIALELALLSFVHAGGGRRRHLGIGAAALATALASAMLLAPLRAAPPDLRAFAAMRALTYRHEPPVAGAVSLPPLHAERAELPSILFVISESIRAEDYRFDGEGATAPSIPTLPGRRFDLRQSRSVASYTAVSLSALLSARSQEAPREEILRSPTLFDFARAARDGKGTRPHVAYFSAQARDIFETKDVPAAVDRFRSIEDLVGHDVDDADEPTVERPLDRLIVDDLVREMEALPRPSIIVLHFGGTHAPYYVDPNDAPFGPVVHYASWRDMALLHNAYKDAIHHQDRALAAAVRAFAAHARGPWLALFTSDHGEAFADHGAIHHGQNLYDEQVHVPGWILASEGALSDAQARALADHADKPVTHLDYLPTVLDALGLWDNVAVRSHRDAMKGKSLLRPYEPRGPIPVTNCTTMFRCPLNTWGIYEDDHKLVAHIYDGAWECLLTRPGEKEQVAPPGDTACPRLASESKKHFPTLPNGQPNR